ncbi:MAG: F0F1 ATP synthase subunit B [Atopobiaceae bacterium]|nr:F0F1 ATP synthase subunit B [Atopobiaceae bacterium]MBR3314282.1 F0F1 ATP synthase subunit B [Atopobiaceae bacterium]
MNAKNLAPARTVAGLSGAVLAALATAPTTAYAAGADILIPKPAEFIPALIAFLAIWLILAKLAWPMIIKTLDAREEKIAGDINAAEQTRADAETTAKEAQDSLAAAHREALDIIAAAKREGEDERAKIIAEAQTSANGIIAKAHEAVENEREKAMIQLSGQVVDLSVEIASKIIGDALDETEQRHLAEKYLLEVGSLND